MRMLSFRLGEILNRIPISDRYDAGPRFGTNCQAVEQGVTVAGCEVGIPHDT